MYRGSNQVSALDKGQQSTAFVNTTSPLSSTSHLVITWALDLLTQIVMKLGTPYLNVEKYKSTFKTLIFKWSKTRRIKYSFFFIIAQFARDIDLK